MSKRWKLALFVSAPAAILVSLLLVGIGSLQGRELEQTREKLREAYTRIDSLASQKREMSDGCTKCADNLQAANALLDEAGASYDTLKGKAAQCAVALVEARTGAAACPVCDCAAACWMPDALCIEMTTDAERKAFTSRLSFHVSEGRWLSTGEWTQDGMRFGSEMGLRLEAGDRNFLRHGGGRPSYDGMVLIASPTGNISYRFGSAHGAETKLLYCGELGWSRIREPGLVGGEE